MELQGGVLYAPRIPPEALPQWRALAAALEEHGPAPCEAAPDRFWPRGRRTPPDPWALWCCGRCPAREACLRYALAANEPEGVWGGTLPAERQQSAQRPAAGG